MQKAELVLTMLNKEFSMITGEPYAGKLACTVRREIPQKPNMKTYQGAGILPYSKELLSYCKVNFENLSLFIREAMREKIASGLLTDPSLSFVEIRCKTPYTYHAKLERVIDGDTLLLNFDVGFFINFQSKVRLIGIDCPPIETDKGKEATTFVEKELKNANLIVDTRKKEKFGRFLAYIYYDKKHKDFEDIIRYGKLLNEELVRAGLANRYYEKVI